MNDFLKNNKGITIISLIVTLILFSILLGLGLSIVTNENNIVFISRNQTEDSEKKLITEQIRNILLDKQRNKLGKELTENELIEILEDFGTIQYDNQEEIYSLIPFDKEYELLIDDLYKRDNT